ncbi:hypothetical protein ACIPYV_00690 [Paenarthrobacter nicotinovorans]
MATTIPSGIAGRHARVNDVVLISKSFPGALGACFETDLQRLFVLGED